VRILAAHPGPNFSVHDVYVGWVEALRELGQHVIEFNLDERLTFYERAMFDNGDEFERALTGQQARELAENGLYATLYKTRPDVLLVVSAFFLSPHLLDLARAYGTRVVLLCTESPYEDGRQLLYAEHVDLVLLNDPANIDVFRNAAPSYYMPHAYRPAVHYPGAGIPELDFDFAFVGTGYASRVAFFEAMGLERLYYAEGLEVDAVLAGNWQQLDDDSPLRRYVGNDPTECLDNEQAADLYRSSKVGMNLYRREAERPELSHGWAMGPREVEMSACGMFFLRDPRGEGDEVLSMLPRFSSPEEASELLAYYLEHASARRRLAESARAAIADRTFTANALSMLRLLDKGEG
jgi:spore maturation protein CgeB